MAVYASRDDAELRLSEGTVIEGVEVVSELERGGMAIVYRGRRRVDGLDVALKVGTAEAARHQTEERFRNEARLGDSLRHPNIVRPLQVGCLDGPEGFEGRMYLVTELVEGRTLSWSMLYHQQGMPVEQVVRLMTQLAEAMVAMHEQGIVHRDLKPANIIVDADERVHVIDFGLAYALGDGSAERTPDLTIDGAAPGTPLYMSPQQALHEEPQRSFDVYAFGVILYELLSGAAPNSGLPSQEVVAVRCNPKSKLFPLRRVAPGAPDALVKLTERCLSYDAEARPSASDLVSALRAVEKGRDCAAVIRAVPEPQGHEPVSSPRTTVVAQGARPARDETIARIAREGVALPAGQRVRELADELVEGDSAGTDERRLIPIAEVKAAVAIVDDQRGKEQGEEEPAVGTEAPADDHGGAKGLALAVGAILFAGVVVAGWAWWPRDMVVETERMMNGVSVSAAGMLDAAGHDVGPESEDETLPGPKVKTPPEPEGKTWPGPETKTPPEPAVKPRKSRKGRRKKPAVTTSPEDKPRPLTPCAGQRVEAKKASKAKAWKSVLASTKDASCWSSKTERALLRAEALMRLGRYAGCVRESAGHADSELVRLNGECYRRASEE